MIIQLKDATCTHCGSGRKTIDIKQFRKDMFPITETTLRIWNDKKCCWRCKKKPKVNERWGISINHGEKNRIYCPECADFIQKQIDQYENQENKNNE